MNKGTILVVDDNQATLTLLSQILTREGYQMLPADNGELALASVAAKPPELILLDLRMPGMDGFEVLRRLKAGEESRDIPVIIVSANTETEQRVNGLKLGAVDFVGKPFQQDELLARVKIQVDLGQARARVQHETVALQRANELLQIEIAERARAEEQIRQISEELQQLNDALELRVWERTAQLEAANATLAAAARNLERSNVELEEFAHITSHDLQEPVRTVIGFVQLLELRLADKLDDEAREFIGFAIDGAHRMQRLIQGILAYSRVSTRDLTMDQVDSAASVQEALALLSHRIAETGAEVDVQPLPVVAANHMQLVQLFENMIGNALKFRKDGAPRIRLEAHRDRADWRFSISDNGIGVAPEYRERIFGMFQRLHTEREYPGTGIGLAICKRMVHRYGGQIGVESAADGGAIFWFTLPAQKSD